MILIKTRLLRCLSHRQDYKIAVSYCVTLNQFASNVQIKVVYMSILYANSTVILFIRTNIITFDFGELLSTSSCLRLITLYRGNSRTKEAQVQRRSDSKRNGQENNSQPLETGRHRTRSHGTVSRNGIFPTTVCRTKWLTQIVR